MLSYEMVLRKHVWFLLEPPCLLGRPEEVINIGLFEQKSLNNNYYRREQCNNGKEKHRRGEGWRRDKLLPWVALTQKSPILGRVSLGADRAEHPPSWLINMPS